MIGRKKKITWKVVDKSGRELEICSTRFYARQSRQWYKDNIFEEWLDDVKFPIRIVREQWELIDKKVVE